MARTKVIKYTAKNIPEFLKIVRKCTDEWFTAESTWGPWFRGQSDSRWRLQPGFYRYSHLRRNIRLLEDEIRQEFAVRAPSLGPERPANSWEWYFLMQHCGAPTRLLDWTESALIALFFAVKGKVARNEPDAAVWILEPWKLNEHSVGVKEVIAPGAESGMAIRHGSRYRFWLPDRYASKDPLEVPYPAAIYPTHFSRRISSQRSCFTIHGSEPNGFDRLPADFSGHLRKVVVPGRKAHQIETDLAIAGIDELSIFPDLDGLGRWLSSVMRDENQAQPTLRRKQKK